MEWYIYAIAAYMLTGLALFEWAWASVKTIRDVDEARDSQYPAFRRLDAPKWRKWKFYPGAITILPLRFVVGFGSVILLCIIIRILTICLTIDEDTPLSGVRAKLIRFFYKIECKFVGWVGGIIPI